MIKTFIKKSITVLLGAAIIVGVLQTNSLSAKAWEYGDSYYDLGSISGSWSSDYEARVWQKLFAIQKAYEKGTPATAVAEDEEGGTLPLIVMQALADRPDITFEYTFIYKEEKHKVIIPAGQSVANEKIQWYGPEYLMSVYGDALAEPSTTLASTTPPATEAAPANTYTIQKGDTLNKIAKKLGTTTADILAKNPYITNANKIYPGKVIAY